MDSTIGHLRASLAGQSERTLALAMHFPTRWDPYFNDVMTIADVYRYPTQHYEHHRRQLTTRCARRLNQVICAAPAPLAPTRRDTTGDGRQWLGRRSCWRR